MRRFNFVVFTIAALIAGFTVAAPPSILVPADVQLAANIDLDRVKANPLGQQLVGGFQSGISASLANDPESASATEMIDALGFDPIAAAKRITVLCSDFENPPQSVCVIIELEKTTGNLEGLLLAMPEYQSSIHRDYQIHSVVLDGDRLFGSIHTADNGTKRIIAGLAAQPVQQVLDHFDGQTGAELSRRLPLATGNLVDINLFTLPEAAVSEPPFSTAAEMIQTAALTLSDQGTSLRASVDFVTQVDGQAEQLRQMIQGSVAMINSMAQNGTDPGMALAANYLQSVSINRSGKTVSVTVEIPQAMLAEQLSAAMGN
ncbi:hypothetical protein Mal15_11900 [Stieleria maiorica]|uniref:Uncharacterized protein n=1 Tax=Stieleria maiorica TaxID=2795974 RepID=A0A5B9M7N7_9BACT|nr:hypothetical protein [Stieleria maiorica]QEF97152.1 hypothetical protein Mal15_11900 [Stieleria maiorica]